MTTRIFRIPQGILLCVLCVLVGQSQSAGWFLADKGKNCDVTCNDKLLLCEEEELLAHNNEVDTSAEVLALVKNLGGTTSLTNCNTQFGTAKDVPNYRDSAECFVSSGTRGLNTFDCSTAAAGAKRRLCWCSANTKGLTNTKLCPWKIIPWNKEWEPSWRDCTNCLNGNKGYNRMEDAWNQCLVTVGCGLISQFVDTLWYLRRVADPVRGLTEWQAQSVYISCTTAQESVFTHLFNGCPRGSGAESNSKHGYKQRSECEAICASDPMCNAYEINGCQVGDQCGGDCYTFKGSGYGFINGNCDTDGSQKTYGRASKGFDTACTASFPIRSQWGDKFHACNGLCLDDNRGYERERDAYNRCRTVQGCGLITKFQNGLWYLRRSDDPVSTGSLPWTPQSITFSCTCTLPPPSQWDAKWSDCPSPGDCLNSNTPYYSINDAWNQCIMTPECGLISRFQDNNWYLRRNSDPVRGILTWRGKSISLSCTSANEEEEEGFLHYYSLGTMGLGTSATDICPDGYKRVEDEDTCFGLSASAVTMPDGRQALLKNDRFRVDCVPHFSTDKGCQFNGASVYFTAEDCDVAEGARTHYPVCQLIPDLPYSRVGLAPGNLVCPNEPGYCITADGEDENGIQLSTDAAMSEEDCFMLCKDWCHKIVPGSSRATQTERCANDGERHRLRCCSNTPISGYQQSTCFGNPFWSESDSAGFNGCQDAVTWKEGNQLCESMGARLCTAEEVASDCTAGTGCLYDLELIWTSTSGQSTSTGCELNTVGESQGCYLHINPIDRGNSAAGSTCWVFDKCYATPVVVCPTESTTNETQTGIHTCGPKFGFKSCPTTNPYCNEETGWCGSTDVYKDAQDSTTYDSCEAPTNSLICPEAQGTTCTDAYGGRKIKVSSSWNIPETECFRLCQTESLPMGTHATGCELVGAPLPSGGCYVHVTQSGLQANQPSRVVTPTCWALDQCAPASHHPVVCFDKPSTKDPSREWIDGCDNYAKNKTWCKLYGGTDWNGDGKANDHCCTCGGGSLGHTTRVDVSPKGNTCPSEPGFCLTESGQDQNDGVFLVGSTTISKEKCVWLCRNYPGSTGCETNPGGCYVHTKSVDRGDGTKGRTCWAFYKCTDLDNLQCFDLPGASTNTKWRDGENTCDDYVANPAMCALPIAASNWLHEGLALDHCCVCGGGSAGWQQQRQCIDTPGKKSGGVWPDGCSNFEKNPGWCQKFGLQDQNGEGSARDHCCACGGGTLEPPNSCVCPNGTPVSTGRCLKDGAEQCASCNAPWTLEGDWTEGGGTCVCKPPLVSYAPDRCHTATQSPTATLSATSTTLPTTTSTPTPTIPFDPFWCDHPCGHQRGVHCPAYGAGIAFCGRWTLLQRTTLMNTCMLAWLRLATQNSHLAERFRRAHKEIEVLRLGSTSCEDL